MAIYREQCAERSAIALYSVDFGADSHYSGEFAEPAHSIRDVLAQGKGVAKRDEAKAGRSEARRDGDEDDERGEAKRGETKRTAQGGSAAGAIRARRSYSGA